MITPTTANVIRGIYIKEPHQKTLASLGFENDGRKYVHVKLHLIVAPEKGEWCIKCNSQISIKDFSRECMEPFRKVMAVISDDIDEAKDMIRNLLVFKVSFTFLENVGYNDDSRNRFLNLLSVLAAKTLVVKTDDELCTLNLISLYDIRLKSRADSERVIFEDIRGGSLLFKSSKKTSTFVKITASLSGRYLKRWTQEKCKGHSTLKFVANLVTPNNMEQIYTIMKSEMGIHSLILSPTLKEIDSIVERNNLLFWKNKNVSILGQNKWDWYPMKSEKSEKAKGLTINNKRYEVLHSHSLDLIAPYHFYVMLEDFRKTAMLTLDESRDIVLKKLYKEPINELPDLEVCLSEMRSFLQRIMKPTLNKAENLEIT